ncbi:piggyBac transposable element-derived protein 4-like [Oreochromis aureus]|uniref:piggyBac transposable element-derived protein 4-like n=1 Tax=Oreochromis aureus TaxID=47969 RepID=UPI0019543809|nr:piggyBac transposable element-derived protein 4-like [Oreochromis aureus]
MAYFLPEIEDSVIAMTNLEADRRRPAIDGWKPMGRVEFRAYVGLLVLAGVYRSRGEACESLWDAESSRETRRARRGEGGGHGYDKLAPIRAVWDEWCARLPAMYRPGPEVTVDERLVPFRGRCPFRQYMPSQPARYGIRLASSSYAWKMQVYTGKPDKRGPPEKHLATRVVVDLTEGLAPGRNTRDPRELRCIKGRAVDSVESVELGGSAARGQGGGEGGGRGPDTIILSYVTKKNKNVLLFTTAPRYHHRSDPEPRPSRSSSNMLHYNRTKGGVDNLDKVVSTYSCRRKTCRWPVALFHNMVDVAAYNAFVLWREIHPDWMAGKLNKRRLFLERLGKALAHPMIEARALARGGGGGGGGGGRAAARGTTATTTTTTTEDDDADASTTRTADATPRDSSPVKRRRCRVCPRSKDVKTKILCHECRAYVCTNCAVTYCPNCAASRSHDTGLIQLCPESLVEMEEEELRTGLAVLEGETLSALQYTGCCL